MLSPAQQKIKGQHRERLAVVYLRQSSARQVRENFRSTERQYGLAEEAVKLGWEPERVLTIDGDLGVSGRDVHPREAYKELVGRVCLGEVGAILGLEVSRLARSSAETQRLLEYCGLTDTLVIDTDGIYDLRDFNDQLVLGVKGQLAQAAARELPLDRAPVRARGGGGQAGLGARAGGERRLGSRHLGPVLGRPGARGVQGADRPRVPG